MPLLPAQIPDIPESRSEIVPARLARKVGPLFGVAWEAGPFGRRTWVSDHSRITLSEIARGAPSPTRTQAAELAASRQGTDPVDGWCIVDRIGIATPDAPMPNEIANATLNRFGPDTRAAVLLTAVNRLLEPVRAAVEQALSLLVDATGAPVDPELRLAAWTVLVVETFRSQPALVAAGIGARTIQRELVAAWRLPLAPGSASVPLTRCEISAPDRPGAPSQPCELDVVDRTFGALQLDGTVGPTLARRLRRDEIVDHLLRRLRAAGTLQDSSHLWISERRPDELVVEALVPPTRLTHDFVAQFVPDASEAPLPRVPTPEDFDRLPLLTRRALLIALLGVLRHVQSFARRREATRGPVVAALSAIATLARTGLPPTDPVRAVVRCRTSLMTVQTLRHDTANDLSSPLLELLAAADDCAAAYRSGILDRGAAAEILGGANIEVNIVRLTNATDPAAGLPSAAHLDSWLRTSWQTYLDALEIDLTEDVTPGLIGYHLHNYAAFLGGHPDSEADLLAAVRLFRDVVLPARDLFVERGGGFEALRNTLQVATRATSSLAALSEDAGPAREWAALGLGWIRRALEDPGTRDLLAGETERACRFALLAGAALLTAYELEVPSTGPADTETVAELVRLARRWEQTSVAGGPESHVRHAEVLDLERRLDRVRGTGPGLRVGVPVTGGDPGATEVTAR